MLEFDLSKLGRLGKVYDLATEVKVVRDGDDSFEQNRGTDWTDWTDVGLGKYVTESTDERETNPEGMKSERRNSSDYGILDNVDPVHLPHAPHPYPANSNGKINLDKVGAASEWAHKEAQKLDEEKNAAKLKEYDRLSALLRKKSKEDFSGDKNDPQAKPPSGGIG